MTGYKKFIFAFVVILAIYIVAEINRPKPFNWDMTLSNEDKDPYGTYILYQQLKDLFPKADIDSYRLPVYNQVNNFESKNTAYFLIDPDLQLNANDVSELQRYVALGNYVFLSAENFSRAVTDTLKFKTTRRFDFTPDDSAAPALRNPALRSTKQVKFNKITMDGYINELDTAKSIVLGTDLRDKVNFIKMPVGKGAFFIHASPVCFSNYFLVTADNADYTARALSYLPRNISTIFWDEYYKLGPSGSRNPLRFLLNDPYLSWAFRIGVVTMLIFVLFEMKRRQRVIPVINPLKNTTLEFVQTVGTVYFNQRDNKNIALKKISYFLEYIRSVFFLPTAQLNDELRAALAKKSGMPESEIRAITELIETVQTSSSITDETLLSLNKKIDSFYEQVK